MVRTGLSERADARVWAHGNLAPARAELSRLGDDELLRRLYFDPAVVRRDAAILRRYHLAVFR